MWQCPGQLLVSEESLKLQKKFVSLGLAESLQQQQQQRHASSQYLSVFLGQGESTDGKQSACMVDAQENAAQVIPGFLEEDGMNSARKRSEQPVEIIQRGKSIKEQLEIIDEKINENKVVVVDKDATQDGIPGKKENKQQLVKVKNLKQIESSKDNHINSNTNSETQSIDENVFDVEQVYSFSNHTMSSMPTKLSVPEIPPNINNLNNNNNNNNNTNIRSRTLPMNSFRATSATFALGSSNETLMYSATPKSFQNYSNTFIPSQNVLEKGFNTDESSNLCFANLTHNTINNANTHNNSISSQNGILLRGQQLKRTSIISAAHPSSINNNNNIWATNATTTAISPQSPAMSKDNETESNNSKQIQVQQHQQIGYVNNNTYTPPAKKLLYRHEQQPMQYQNLKNNTNSFSSNNISSFGNNDNNYNNNSEVILNNNSSNFIVPNISINGSEQQYNDQMLNFTRIQQQIDYNQINKDKEEQQKQRNYSIDDKDNDINRDKKEEGTTTTIDVKNINEDLDDDHNRNAVIRNSNDNNNNNNNNNNNDNNIQFQQYEGIYSFFYNKSGVEGDNEPALEEEAVEVEIECDSQNKRQLQLPGQEKKEQLYIKETEREVESEYSSSSCTSSSHSSSFSSSLSSSHLSEEDEEDQNNNTETVQQQLQQQQLKQNQQLFEGQYQPPTTEQFSDFGSCRGKAVTGHFFNSRSQNQMSSPQQRSLASSRSRAQTGFFGAVQDHIQSQQIQGQDYIKQFGNTNEVKQQQQQLFNQSESSSNQIAQLKTKLQQFQSKQLKQIGRGSNLTTGTAETLMQNDTRSYKGKSSIGKLSDLGKETKSIEGSKDDVGENERRNKKKKRRKSNNKNIKAFMAGKVCNSSSQSEQQLESQNNTNKNDSKSPSVTINNHLNGMYKKDRIDGSSKTTIDNYHSRNNITRNYGNDVHNNKDKSTANGNSNNLSSVSNHTSSNNNNNNIPGIGGMNEQRNRQSLSGSQAVLSLATHRTHQIFKSIVMLFSDQKSDDKSNNKNIKDQKDNNNNHSNKNNISKVTPSKNIPSSTHQSPALKGITLTPTKDNQIQHNTNNNNSRSNLALVSNNNNTNSQFPQQRDLGLLDLCEKCRNVNSESRNLSIAHPSEQDLIRKHLPEMNSNHNINYMTNPSKLTNSPSGWNKTAKDSHGLNFFNNNSSTPSDQFKDMPKLVQSISSQTNRQIQQWQLQQMAQYQVSQQYPLSWRSEEEGEGHAMLNNTHSNGCRCFNANGTSNNNNNINPVKSIYNTLANHSPNIIPQNHHNNLHHNHAATTTASGCHHHHHHSHHHHHNTSNIQQESNINFIGNHNNISNNIIINNNNHTIEPIISLTQITSCNHLNSLQNIPNERNNNTNNNSKPNYDQSGVLLQQIPISTSNQGFSQLHQFLNSDRSSVNHTHHTQKLSWQNAPYNINVSSPKDSQDKQQSKQQQFAQQPRIQQLQGGGDVSNISISRYFFASPHLGASSRVADIHQPKNINFLGLNSNNNNNNNTQSIYNNNNAQQQSTASFMLAEVNGRKLTNSGGFVQASNCIDQGCCGMCGSADQADLIELSPKCKHLFCLPCVTLFLENKITSNEVIRIRCPRQGCRSVVHTSAFKHLIPHTLLNRYKQHRKIILQRQNPNIRYCTKTGCDGFMIGSPEHPKLICPKCGQAVCYNCCNNYHYGQRCDQAIEEDAVKELAENNRQVCPRCSHKQPLMIVDSTSDSNRCVCEKCRFVFCNLCLRECGRFHFAPWNLCGCPGRKYGDGDQNVFSKLCVFLWGVMKLLMYFLGWVLAVVIYPIGICLISLFMPLVLYAYFKGQRLQYSGWKKYLLLFGLFFLGIVLYPLWVVIAIVPGTCIFFKDLYLNRKQDIEKSTFVY